MIAISGEEGTRTHENNSGGGMIAIGGFGSFGSFGFFGAFDVIHQKVTEAPSSIRRGGAAEVALPK